MIYIWSPEHRPCIIPQPKRLARIDWLVSIALKDELQGTLLRDQADERGKDCSSAQRFDPDLATQECLPYVSNRCQAEFQDLYYFVRSALPAQCDCHSFQRSDWLNVHGCQHKTLNFFHRRQHLFDWY